MAGAGCGRRMGRGVVRCLLFGHFYRDRFMLFDATGYERVMSPCERCGVMRILK